MCICVDFLFPVLFNWLLKSIILIYFDLQIIPTLTSENYFNLASLSLTYSCHFLNTFLLSGVRCLRLIFFN